MVCILSKIPGAKNIEMGIYAKDTLPNYVIKYSSIYMVDTIFSHDKVKHWVLFYFEYKNNALFFDSLEKTRGFIFVIF